MQRLSELYGKICLSRVHIATSLLLKHLLILGLGIPVICLPHMLREASTFWGRER